MDTLHFEPVSLEKRKIMTGLLHAAPERGCEYTFGNLFIWRNVYGTAAALTEDGMLLLRFARDVGSDAAYLFPVGEGDLKRSVDAMLAYSAGRDESFRIIAARKEDCESLRALYGDIFDFHTSRDFAEYVYKSEDLIKLAGKKYHGKRNHISRFISENPEYEFSDIDEGNIEEVLEMSEKWYREVFAEEGQDYELSEERLSVLEAFHHYFELGFKGGVLRAGGKIVAYSMGEPINEKSFCVHIEKACYNTTGAYTMVNREFAARFCADYEYINREDDVGDEGLRRAKLSYHPEIITEKYVVRLK